MTFSHDNSNPLRKMYALTERDYLKCKSYIAEEEEATALKNSIKGDDQKVKIYANQLARDKKVMSDVLTAAAIQPKTIDNEEDKSETFEDDIMRIPQLKSIIDKFPIKLRSKSHRILNSVIDKNIKWNKELNIIKADGNIIEDSNIIDLIYYSTSGGTAIPGGFKEFSELVSLQNIISKDPTKTPAKTQAAKTPKSKKVTTTPKRLSQNKKSPLKRIDEDVSTLLQNWQPIS